MLDRVLDCVCSRVFACDVLVGRGVYRVPVVAIFSEYSSVVVLFRTGCCVVSSPSS